MSFEDLAVFREKLLDIVRSDGPDGIKKFAAEHRRNNRKNPENVQELKKSIYMGYRVQVIHLRCLCEAHMWINVG